MSIDKPKGTFYKNERTLSSKQIQEKAKQLLNRFSRQNICKEFNIIKHMNPKLQIKFQHLKKDKIFQNVNVQDILKILQKIKFLKRVEPIFKNFYEKIQQRNNKKLQQDKEQNLKQLTYKIQYLDMERVILSTGNKKVIQGITKSFIKEAVKQYNAQKNSNYYSGQLKKNDSCIIVGQNEYWIAIQAINYNQAYHFKKFIRNKKKQLDMQFNTSYKQDKKRVRIIMLNEDFYTLLVDAMSQKKGQIFSKKVVSINQYRNIIQNNSPIKQSHYKNKATYKEIQNNVNYLKKEIFYTPIQTWGQNSISNKQENKDEETLNNCFLNSTFDDFVSEDLSKNSEVVDYRKFQDLIQTTEQGIQAQNQGELAQSQRLFQNASKAKLFSSQNNEQIRCTSNQIKQTQNLIRQNNDSKRNQHSLDIKRKLTQFDKLQDAQNYIQNANNLETIDSLKKDEKDIKLKQSEQNLMNHSLFLHLKQISSQTMLKYTQMKKYENQFAKKTKHKNIMAPGIPEDFKQISDQMKYKEKFFQTISKKMFKMNQPKKMQWEQ